jgi:hypothetical protein
LSDQLGPIVITPPPTISAFPLTADFTSGYDFTPPIATHTFDQPGLKTEQRFLLGSGERRFRVTKARLACNEYDQLKTHWAQAQGAYAQFPYTHVRPDGSETVTARYENPNLSFPHLVAFITGDPGVTLLEVPTTFPSYTSAATVTRFPDSALTTALQSQVQRMIPLITITPRDASGAVYLSNQRCTVNGQLYLPRLLDWNGISQTIGESSDSARFTFGNADDAFTKWANAVNLQKAGVQFSLYHVNTNYLIKLWGGYALPWQMDSSGQFVLPASDGVCELGLAYPTRQLSRTCWKVYKGRFCPSTATFPDCPKSYEACVARGVPKSFGGVVADAQTVHIKDNSTGVFGFGRSQLTSVSIAEDSIYQRTVQEVYTDRAMKVTADVAAGRDESDFYSALGIVSEGPIGKYDPNLVRHTLDGQPCHDPRHGGGWRGILGNDPAGVQDFFGLDQSPWNTVPAGSTYAGGLAFAEIRRTDTKGLQLSVLSDRAMVVTVDQGISGWTWTAIGNRVWTAGLSNTVWVAVNVYLRAIGLRVDSTNAGAILPSVMEQYVDIPQAIAAAAICDTMVDKLVGTGQEKQFPFRGVLKEKKPLKDWLQEILNCCLGFFTFVNGKLWIGIRFHSGVVAGNAFTRDSILFKSLQAVPLQPQFNWLIGAFGDEEFDWALNNITIYDIDAASLAGDGNSPQYLTNTMNFVGVSNKSQCARIITTRLREEIGGVGPAEQRAARNLGFRTTVLALKVLAGDIISLDHTRLPNGRCEGRVQSWTLNPDFSIDIKAAATTDSMYALDVGPKPDDVAADPVIPERLPSINGLTWMPDEVGPFAGDPLYPDILQRTFDLWQDYRIARDGAWDAAIIVAGQMCINDFAPGQQPRLLGAVPAAGGNLNGPQTVYIAITQRMNTMQPLTPSNLVGLWIPAGVTGQKVTLTVSNSPDSDQPWDLWAGNDRRTMAWQSSGTNVQPSVDFLGPIHNMTKGLPEAAARKVAIAAKHVWHSGIAGVQVHDVFAPNRIQSNDFIGSSDTWVGRTLSALADLSDGSAPLWNFKIIGFDGSNGQMSLDPICVRTKPDNSPDPENSIQVGDVLIVRSMGITSTANSVSDPMWNNFVGRNQFGSPGLDPTNGGVEKGRICRILFGKGAGQFRYITGNTYTTINVTPDWDILPDSTSVIIVEDADWAYERRTSDLDVPREGSRVEIRMRVDNLKDKVALVGGFLVDDQERLSDEAVAPLREIFIYAQPPSVRTVGPGALDPDGQPWEVFQQDQTVNVDTTARGITLQLLPLAQYEGRTLLIHNTGGNTVTIKAYGSETFYDGSTQVLVTGNGATVRITSGATHTELPPVKARGDTASPRDVPTSRSWIPETGGGGGGGMSPYTVSGTKDGTNTVFTVPVALTSFQLFRNGVLQALTVPGALGAGTISTDSRVNTADNTPNPGPKSFSEFGVIVHGVGTAFSGVTGQYIFAANSYRRIVSVQSPTQLNIDGPFLADLAAGTPYSISMGTGDYTFTTGGGVTTITFSLWPPTPDDLLAVWG